MPPHIPASRRVPRSRGPLGPALLALLLATAPACTPDPGPLLLAEGISLELARLRAGTLSQVSYDLTLHVPASLEERLHGTMRVAFIWDDPRERPLVLDFLEPASRVAEVRVAGEPVAWDAVEDHLVIPPEVLESGGHNEVVVDFTAGDEALNRSGDFLYTLFVPDRAHFSIPVFDQPDLKARVRLALTVPEGWVAVANGPEEGGGAAEAGRRTWRFAETEPIPTYLMAFAAGRFQVEEATRAGRRYRMYHRETDGAKVVRNRDEIFDLVARSVAWMEDYTGIAYPFAKHDFVLLPPFQYGGMEHPGAIFYRQSSLMLDESATQGALLGRASLIAHEVAHMWFGDLVTMRWFDDVWTKEVYANFFAAKIVNPSFPEVDHELRFLLAHHPSAYAVDRTPGANPIRQPLDNLREAGTLYGAIIYQKAPIVMRQLEERVGPELLRTGLRRYLERHAYGNATWPELIAILDELVDDDLAAWSRVWVEEPGRPRISLRREAAGRLVITQEDPWERGRVWPQRLRPAGPTGSGGELLRTEVELEGVAVELTDFSGGGAPRWVLPNAAGLAYGLFEVEDEALAALLDDLPALEPALLRGAGWLLVEDALLAGRLDPGDLQDRLLGAVADEENELLLSFLLGMVGDIHWRLLTDGDRAARSERLEETLAQGLQEADTRTARATWFGAWRRMATSPSAVARMRRIWSGEEEVPGLPLSEPDRTALATSLALRGVDDAEAILDRQAEAIDNPDRRARFDFTRPALSSDAAVREAFFASLAEVEKRAREPWVLSALGALHHPLRRGHAVRFVGPSLELLEEIQRTGDIFFPGRWLGATLGSHNDPEVAARVVDFLEENPDLPERLRAKVLQSADGVVRAALLVHGEAPTLPGPAAR